MLKFVQVGRLFDLVLHILKALLPIHIGHFPRLVHLSAHLNLVLELGARDHRTLNLLLLPRLIHVLIGYFSHVLEVLSLLVAQKSLSLVPLGHLIL